MEENLKDKYIKYPRTLSREHKMKLEMLKEVIKKIKI
jgi:hypothetical protein